MEDCIFCKIADKKIKSNIVVEGEEWVCFEDVNPKAPVHLLLIPKKHYSQLHDISDDAVWSMLMNGITRVVKERDLLESGYRVVTNSGVDGGQTVNHLHFHILGKRRLGWPPG